MFWNDVSFLVVSSSVTGKFKDFSSEVFHDGGEIYRGSGSNGDVEKYTGASHFVSLAAIRSFLVVSSSVTGKFKDFSSKTPRRFLSWGHQYGDDKSPKNGCMCLCV